MMRSYFRILLFALLFGIAASVVGCAKDAAVGFANAVLINIGDNALTKSVDLAGYRRFGSDPYTGTYAAAYDDATQKEKLFGSVCIERPDGAQIHLSASMTKEAGSGRLVLNRGWDEPVVLLNAPGSCSEDLEVDGGVAYIAFECEAFTGTLDVSIE